MPINTRVSLLALVLGAYAGGAVALSATESEPNEPQASGISVSDSDVDRSASDLGELSGKPAGDQPQAALESATGEDAPEDAATGAVKSQQRPSQAELRLQPDATSPAAPIHSQSAQPPVARRSTDSEISIADEPSTQVEALRAKQPETQTAVGPEAALNRAPNNGTAEPVSDEGPPAADTPAPRAENIDLREVVESPVADQLFESKQETAVVEQPVLEGDVRLSASETTDEKNSVRRLLGVDIPPATTTRLDWTPSKSFSGIAVDTPVLVVNGAWDGPTLCLTAAIHGDELNGIEMVRRVLYDLEPQKLHGMVVGVPIVNLLGFSRNSRYLPDRRDLNRYFPGNPRGSVASRLAHAFFQDVIKQCDALVDLHTGSFYRTNIPQLRADMRNPKVAEFASLFGDIPVLNTRGNANSLRAAAVRAGIPAVTLEAGEPMRMQVKVVQEGVKAINTLMEKNGMYPSFSLWAKPSPAYYRSAWVRANASGILFSAVKLGGRVKKGDKLGEVINPVTNDKKTIISAYDGRVLGMALDQFVLPGFAAYHIGIREPVAKVAGSPEEDAIDADDLSENEEKPTALEEPKPLSPEEEGYDD